MESLSRGIDRQQGSVVEQRDFDRVLGTFFIKPDAVVLRLQAFNDGLLDGALNARSGGQHRLDRLGIDWKQGIDGQPLFPRHLLGAFEELFEVGTVKLPDDQLDAFGGSQPQVCLADRRQVALEPDAAIFDFGVGVSELLDFAFDNCFESERRSGDEFYLLHVFLQ